MLSTVTATRVGVGLAAVLRRWEKVFLTATHFCLELPVLWRLFGGFTERKGKKMAKKKTNWLLWGGVAAAGWWLFTRKKEDEQALVAAAVAAEASAANAAENAAPQAQSDYVAVSEYMTLNGSSW